MYYTAKRGEWQEDSEKRERQILWSCGGDASSDDVVSRFLQQRSGSAPPSSPCSSVWKRRALFAAARTEGATCIPLSSEKRNIWLSKARLSRSAVRKLREKACGDAVPKPRHLCRGSRRAAAVPRGGEKWINRTLGEKNTPFQANKIKKIASWWIQRSSARHCIIEYGFEERRRPARFKVMQPAFLFSLHCRDGAIPPPFREPSWSRRTPPWKREWFPADRCGILRRRRLPAFRASRHPDGRNRYPRRS